MVMRIAWVGALTWGVTALATGVPPATIEPAAPRAATIAAPTAARDAVPTGAKLEGPLRFGHEEARGGDAPIGSTPPSPSSAAVTLPEAASLVLPASPAAPGFVFAPDLYLPPKLEGPLRLDRPRVRTRSAIDDTELRLPPAEPAVACEGVASWYGGKFHGRKTACGEIYDQDGLTAAHRTLPFGTRLAVTNVDTGQSVVLRVNDRGPYHGSRILDCSRGAARALGFVDDGLAHIKWEVLGKADPVARVSPEKPAAADAPVAPPTPVAPSPETPCYERFLRPPCETREGLGPDPLS
jgi:hypothetical protein